MKIYKPKFWDKKYHTFFSIILWPISFLYQIVISIKETAASKKKFSIPVICVGNIYLGGTGKTPLSIKIWEIFKDEKRPVVLKKNYKNHQDEIELIKKYCKILVSDKRSDGINRAIEKNFDLVIMDDGSQDFEIIKNLNIICFNSQQGIGNGYTIPSGPLRENLKSLKKCQIILINGKKNLQFEDKLKIYNNKLEFFYFNYFIKNVNEFKNKKLIPFAGIGNPENFFQLLKDSHLNIVKEINFPDHYEYKQADLDNLVAMENKYKAKLVTTEKDYLRISPFNRRRFEMLPIKVNIHEEKKFSQSIKKFIT
tara:strand:+ start:2997 stop:3926 length:930 start_codon:yes stop_codon:yes gene_type:complete